MKFKKTNIAYLLKNIFPWGTQYNTLLKYTSQVINKLILINEAIHKIAVVLLLFFIMHTITMAQESDGAVCISETKKEPQENSMLEIESDTSGILIPRMSFETMQNIEPKHDGLTVYVTDDDKKGFYFYKEDEDGEGKWVKLMNSTMGRQDVPSPPGTIIMYVGEITKELFDGQGTGKNKMQGWQICNGENNSPDLTGRFMVGAKFENQNTFNSNLEEVGGENTITIDISQIYPHIHTFTPINAKIQPHDHEIPDANHHHKFNAYAGQGKKRDNKIQLVRKKKQRKNNKVISEVKGLTIDDTPETQNTIQFDVKYTEEKGKGEYYDNRPQYIVILYLIKI